MRTGLIFPLRFPFATLTAITAFALTTPAHAALTAARAEPDRRDIGVEGVERLNRRAHLGS